MYWTPLQPRSFLERTALLLAFAVALQAQAWVPQRGQGALTFYYQRISNTGHRLSTGQFIRGGQSLNQALYLGVDYALTNRLSFTVGLPYVFGKYTDSQPPPPPIPYLEWDKCHCWRSGPQDIGLTARYNALLLRDGTFALTPSISAVIPSNKYEFRGESVQGRHLKEFITAVDVGQRLDRISPNLSVLGRYSYAFVERALDIPNNRSNIMLEGRYMLFKGKLAARGFTFWQRTHGGLAGPNDFQTDIEERLFQHDRLLRDNSFHAGGGASYSFPKVDLFGSYIQYVNGRSTHGGSLLTIGISWPFELRRRTR